MLFQVHFKFLSPRQVRADILGVFATGMTGSREHRLWTLGRGSNSLQADSVQCPPGGWELEVLDQGWTLLGCSGRPRLEGERPEALSLVPRSSVWTAPLEAGGSGPPCVARRPLLACGRLALAAKPEDTGRALPWRPPRAFPGRVSSEDFPAREEKAFLVCGICRRLGELCQASSFTGTASSGIKAAQNYCQHRAVGPPGA